MADTIEKLIFALDGDLSALKARYAEAEADAIRSSSKVKATWETSLQSISRSTGTDRSFKDAAASADVFSRALGDTKTASQKLRDAYKETTAEITKGHGATSTATREFRALFDELSSGRTRMAPGTLAIIATRVFGVSGATLGWAAAIAAVPVAFAVAEIQASNSLAHIRQELIMTGNLAGQTVDSIRSIGAQIGQSAGASISRGSAVAAGFSGSYMPASRYAQAGVAEIDAERSGMSPEDASKLITQMFDAPGKALEELQSKMHLLTEEQAREIEELVQSGEYQKAAGIELDAFRKTVHSAADSASSFSKVMSQIGQHAGDWWSWLGSTGKQTDYQALLTTQADLARAQKLASQDTDPHHLGMPKIEGMYPSQAVNVLPEKIIDLQDKINEAVNTAASGAVVQGQTRDQKNADDIGKKYGFQFSDKYGTELEKTAELRGQLDQLNTAIGDASGKTKAYYTMLRDNVDRALKSQRTPDQIAAEEATNRAALVRVTDPAARARLEAQQRAQMERERNMANPQLTDAQVASMYKSNLTDAGDVRASGIDARKGARDAKNLAAMQAESEAELELAKAYDQGSAAVARQKAAGEAHAAFIKGEISNEKAYAAALQQRAFSTEAVNVAQKIANDNEKTASMRAELGAGGDPVKVAQLQAQAEAMSATTKERDNAVTKDQIALADKHLKQLTDELQVQQQLSAALAANKDIYGARQKVGFANDNYNALASGASSDDLRHLEIAQSTFSDLVSKGLDPASDKFREVYQTLLPLNVQLSDMAQKTRELQQAASDMASAVTGAIDQFAMKGGSLKKLGFSILQGEAAATIKDFIIEPLQKNLTSLFSGLLGAPMGKPDGTVMNPLYVIMAPQGMLSGAGFGGGASSLFGTGLGTPGFTPGPDPILNSIGGSSGGLFSSIGSWISGFFADGGQTDPNKMYVVGEKGPELFAPGMSGQVIPFKAPSSSPSSGSGAGAGTVNIRHEMTVVVQGVGDKDLLAKIQAGTEQQMHAAFEQNNKAIRDNQRSNLVRANRRALP